MKIRIKDVDPYCRFSGADVKCRLENEYGKVVLGLKYCDLPVLRRAIWEGYLFMCEWKSCRGDLELRNRLTRLEPKVLGQISVYSSETRVMIQNGEGRISIQSGTDFKAIVKALDARIK